ncbi:MAG: glycosyltransferase [Verrucomicrobia bacterium]|nr:glycosyltransferase [Verrucomicrobiota bacterium]
MKLVIVHYHYRPGGIRRVIELAAPHILRAFGDSLTDLLLTGGEAPDRKWREDFQAACAPATVGYFIEPAFGYFSEQRRAPAKLRESLRRGLERLLDGARAEDTLVWAHNLGLARNLLLTGELTRACEERRVPLLAHHHDWWFDNRWQRWPEARRAGFDTLNQIARVVFGSPRVRHLTINHADNAILKRHQRGRTHWLPNLAEPAPPPPAPRAAYAREWLRHRLDHGAPVWLLPCRLLRRKNVAEALLLTRWLRSHAWLVTTGGVSSADERAYFEKLDAAARAHHWRLRLGVLAGDETRKPSVGELLAASEAVMLTSIQEGFGLPYLEATAAGRPLLARSLPNIAPDLKKFGFRFPQYYQDILVNTELFDWNAERARQRRLFRVWLQGLPAAARKLAGEPQLLSTAGQLGAVPFSRLTLTAQIEVLARPTGVSWEACAPLNPFLKPWRERAESGRLGVAAWPERAAAWLSGEHYGRSFLHAYEESAVASNGNRRLAAVAQHCQTDFIRHKLQPEFLYPLLWGCDS